MSIVQYFIDFNWHYSLPTLKSPPINEEERNSQAIISNNSQGMEINFGVEKWSGVHLLKYTVRNKDKKLSTATKTGNKHNSPWRRSEFEHQAWRNAQYIENNSPPKKKKYH